MYVYSNLLLFSRYVKLQDLSHMEIKMSLQDTQLHLNRSFCWHAGLGYGTRSSPQMKTNNMNLTLLTTNSNFGDEAMGCGGGVNYYSLRFSHTIPRVTNTCNLTDPKLVGYKSMFGSRNFFFRGGGPCPTARNGQRIFLSSYRGGPMV